NVEENETVEQITVKALIPKEIISTGGTDIGQTPYVNHQIPLKLGIVPETLSTEVFWDIPKEVQRNDEACLTAVELLKPIKNPQTRE
ncbi:12651_t:CDS:2, partial [Funneliformis geosporum]